MKTASRQSLIDFGRPVLVGRWFADAVSLRLDLRTLLVCLVLLGLALAVGLVSLATGAYPIALSNVVGALLGQAGLAPGQLQIVGSADWAGDPAIAASRALNGAIFPAVDPAVGRVP